MSGHNHAPARWFTQPASRRTILKAAAALTAISSVPALLSSPPTSAQDSLEEEEGPDIRSGYFSETLSGEGFNLASEEAFYFTAEFPFSAVAAHWAAEAPEDCFVVVELSYDGETWSEPVELHESHDGHEDDVDGRHFSHLLPSDGHQFVRYRSYSPSGGYYEMPDLVFTYIDAFDGPTASENEIELAVSRPSIISRKGWGANEKLRYEKQDTKRDLIYPHKYETVKHAIIHHSVTPNNYYDPAAMMRSIYYFHAITRGWGDIGYNYLVDHRGNIYEGRHGGENVTGTHSGVFNNGSAGICVMGTYENVDISSSAQAALIAIVAWAIRNHNPHEDKWFHGNLLPTIFGHRNISTTSCPGDALYNDLPYIRNAVADVLGSGTWQGGSNDLKPGQTVRVTANDSNVRSGPGTAFSKLRTLDAGTTGTIDGGPVSANGYTWYVVKTSRGTGWMATITFTKSSGSSGGGGSKTNGRFKVGDTVETTGTLTLRTRSGLGYGVIASMPTGTNLRVTYAYNRNDGYEWYKVTGPYGAGWAAGEFMRKYKPKGKFSEGDRVVVNTDTLTLRSAAGTDKAVRASMPRGTALRITYAYNSANGYEWYKVTGNYGSGWVAGEFLRASSGTSSGVGGSNSKPKGKFSVGDRVAVNTDSLTLRSAAGTNKSVRASMPRGTTLRITYAYNLANGYEWYKVTGAYGSGWVAGEFLRKSTGTSSGGSGTQQRGKFSDGDRVVVTAESLTLRSAAGTDKAVRASLPRGTSLRVTYSFNKADGYEWYKVSSPYGTGWVAGSYLRESSGSSSGPKPIKVDYTVYTTDTQVNMRTQPSLGGAVRHRVKKGSKFQVIEGPRSANGYTWWRVRNSKYGSGWLVANYLERR